MNKPTLGAAKKQFGQNFLVDGNYLAKIKSVLQLQPDDACLEIGPGRGALTAELLSVLSRLQAIELDQDLIPYLQQRFGDALAVQQADILRVDLQALAKQAMGGLRIIGNLPYNISTPILFHCLSARDDVRDIHVMLQKEVVERICAKHGNKAYGRLSVMMQYYFEVTALFNLPPTAFRPAPKVWSSFMRLVPRQIPPEEHVEASDFAAVVAAAFNQRRKTLRNSLSSLMDDAAWQQCQVDPKRRAEQLTLAEFIEMSNIVSKQGVARGE